MAAQAADRPVAGQGDFEGVYRHATVISPAGTLASYVPHSLWAALDLVETTVHGVGSARVGEWRARAGWVARWRGRERASSVLRG